MTVDLSYEEIELIRSCVMHDIIDDEVDEYVSSVAGGIILEKEHALFRKLTDFLENYER